MITKILKKIWDYVWETPDAGSVNEELQYAKEEKEQGETYYSKSELFDLWVEYLNHYNISFQELSRKFNVEHSFPKWLEKNKK